MLAYFLVSIFFSAIGWLVYRLADRKAITAVAEIAGLVTGTLFCLAMVEALKNDFNFQSLYWFLSMPAWFVSLLLNWREHDLDMFMEHMLSPQLVAIIMALATFWLNLVH